MLMMPANLPVVSRQPIATADPVSAGPGRNQRPEGMNNALSVEPTLVCRPQHSSTTARRESVWGKACIGISAAATVGVVWSCLASARTWTTRHGLRIKRRGQCKALFEEAMLGHAACCAVSASFMVACADDGARRQA